MKLLFIFLVATISCAGEDFFVINNRLFCNRANPIEEIGETAIGKEMKKDILNNLEFQKQLLGSSSIEVLADTFISMFGGKAFYVNPEQGVESANCTTISSIKVFKHTDSCPKDILVEIFPNQVAFMSRRGIIRRDSSPLDCIDIPRQAFFNDGDQTIWREGSKVWVEHSFLMKAATTLASSQELSQMKQIMTKIFD